jgi:hypothetical protein
LIDVTIYVVSKVTMATRIDPDLFSRIMALPSAERLEMLELAGSMSLGSDGLGKILDDLTCYPVDPGDNVAIKAA